MTDSPAPRRVRVTHPRTGAGDRRRRSVSSEIDAQTELGEVFMRSLMRSQLRLAFAVMTVLGLTVGVVPLLFLLVPSTKSAHVLGMPLPWLLLGVVVYPCLIGLGWLYVRVAERTEQTFSDLVDRS
ncbi:MAG TPA: hypothetical protein VM688_09600 [Nocardioidaceae bacterium]|nr:hypothetical protein [Nocardioidaceae bacterium]